MTLAARADDRPSARPATLGRAIPDRFHALDVARGLAALAVVAHHRVHFSAVGLLAEGAPTLGPLALVHRHGGVAVDFFFALSGFVFHWLYSRRIAEGSVSAREFAASRLSRLYPLHLATLVVVAALQRLYRAGHGADFVYPAEGLGRFAANALLVSSWGVGRGASFNGPSWSISVEVALYILFFLGCRARLLGGWQLLIGAALGRALMWAGVVPIGRGMLGFFLGGLAYLAYRRLLATGRAGLWGGLTVAAAAVGWGLTIVEVNLGLPVPSSLLRLLFHALVIPLTVLALVVAETLLGPLGRRLAWLGEVSYSIYLIHFPMQLAFVLGADALGYRREVFARPATLGLYVGALIPIGLASYHGFERPAQAWLRRLAEARRGAHRARATR